MTNEIQNTVETNTAQITTPETPAPTETNIPQQTPPAQSATTQTVSLETINTPPQKEHFLEKGIKNIVNFIAKITGQPNPQGGTASQMTPQNQTSEASTPISTTHAKTGKSFFDNLVASTQKLLNKTEEFATNAAEKTKNLTQAVRSASEKVVNKTNSVIEKGIAIGEKVRERTESTLEKGMDFGRNLQTTMTDGAQQFKGDPVEATGTVGKGVVKSTAQLGKDL